MSDKPSDFLKKIHRQRVVVKLNSGVIYAGRLAALDSFMNVALEETEEFVNGQPTVKYGDAFIRGNNVLYISPADE
eukprot:m.83441 g.83441  ORF g.83441 m.83441 type:complete len:76 (-) comp14344_c0_seq3:1073-1300(-)